MYAISVRRLGTLPAASFRFYLTIDTLAVRLTLPTTKRVVDFHHQAIAHGGRTSNLRRLLLQVGAFCTDERPKIDHDQEKGHFAFKELPAYGKKSEPVIVCIIEHMEEVIKR
ncbi:MAG: hypothetical protein ACI4MP_00335 [Candidatus Ventricola sp.]